jgi:uncharacterized membrane protein
MNQGAYRRRLENDLTRWVADGIVTAETAAAIRAAVPPAAGGFSIATAVAILGGLLIAAAILAFIAANWSGISRPVRFAVLLVAIAAAYAIGAAFDRRQRTVLADLSVAVGAVIFGAAIALVGQMYHLGEDFLGGLMLWAGGALAAALLTASRGALAVALAAGLLWSGSTVFETGQIPHLPFVPFWLIAAALAVAWNSAPARHLVALAALIWWITAGVALLPVLSWTRPGVVTTVGGSLLLGAGMVLSSRGPDALRAFGATLSTYGGFAVAIASAAMIVGTMGLAPRAFPAWVTWSGVAGIALALLAVLGRRAGPALAALGIGLILAVGAGWAPPRTGEEPYLAYALVLTAMICLVLSGILDEVRARTVAGWLGLALTIAAITWIVEGSLLNRAIFLGLAGAAAVGISVLLGRVVPHRGQP